MRGQSRKRKNVSGFDCVRCETEVYDFVCFQIEGLTIDSYDSFEQNEHKKPPKSTVSTLFDDDTIVSAELCNNDCCCVDQWCWW